jgi:hypothetical protein
MLFSGELSMTTSELPLAAADDEAADELGVVPPAEVELDVLDEQAARPAARSPAAVSASALLLGILLLVNFDLSSRRFMRLKRGSLFFLVFSMISGAISDQAVRLQRGGCVQPPAGRRSGGCKRLKGGVLPPALVVG